MAIVSGAAALWDWPVKAYVAFAWAVGPPFYFWAERMWLFDNWSDPNAVDEFNKLQEVAAKVWAGGGVFLAYVYLKGISV